MKIENCPKCGGTHFGQYECPIFCICCASGNDLPEGEWCRACGRVAGNGIVNVDDELHQVLAEALKENR